MTLSFQREFHRIQRLCGRPDTRLRARLTFASGILLSGLLAFRFAPLPATTAPTPLPGNLDHGAFLLRQSILTLYTLQEQQRARVPAAAGTGTNDAPVTGEAAATAAAPSAPPTAAPAASATSIDEALEMRVAIARGVSSLEVGSNTQGWLVDIQSQERCDIPAQTSFMAQPSGGGINFNGCQLSGAVWLEAVHGGQVFVGGSWYRGRVLLLNQGNRLLAVNFVLLGNYLSSVVGSEMYPDWPLEALKAQAVAARSYALTHHVRPASDHFDLDNTQRYQAYKGIAVETNTTQAAVTATAGEFISYQGGIVESLYAASDQIVQEAHGGQGMSQTGAKNYAAQGYTYGQILSTYYPGTGLSRLVVQ
jgi:stage II sporulation protein D